MPSALPLDVLSRLETASRALLSPLAFGGVDAWRAEVLAAARPLFGADRGMFMLSTAPQIHFSDDLDRQILGAFDHHVAEHTPRGPRLSDPIVQRWLDRRRETGEEVFSNRLVDRLIGEDRRGLRHSSIYNEAMAPGGFRDQRTLYVSFGSGEAMLQLGYERLSGAPEHDASVSLLRVLAPAFKAGLDALDRLGAHRAALDATAEPLAAFSPDARETHRTPALARLLLDDPESVRIEAAIADAARRTRPLAFARRADEAAPPIATVEVQTARATYTLRPALLASASALGDAFLVTVAARGIRAAIAPAEVLRQRHGLTAREAEVVALVAEGLSNVAIGERLFLSRHTVRHHVETAAQKLGLTGAGRGAITAALLEG